MGNYRKYVTTSVGFTFLVVAVTGITFKFFFKNHVLEDIHGWIGVAMVIAAIFHIRQNWPSLRTYLRDKRVFGLLVPIFLVIALFSLAPGKKERGANAKQLMRGLTHGRAGDVAKALAVDLRQIESAMKRDGLNLGDTDETIESIAKSNKKTPEVILRYFVPQ